MPEIEDPNSALYWVPKIIRNPDIKKHMPTIAFFDVDKDVIDKFLIDNHERMILFPKTAEQQRLHSTGILKLIDEITYRFSMPIFVSTDMKAAKEYGELGYKIRSIKQMTRVLFRTLYSAKHSGYPGNKYKVLMIQDWIHYDPRIKNTKSILREDSIVRKFKFFVVDGEVVCWHFMPFSPRTVRFDVLNKQRERYLQYHEGIIKEMSDLSIASAILCTWGPYNAWFVEFIVDMYNKTYITDMGSVLHTEHPICYDKEKYDWNRLSKGKKPVFSIPAT